ncbi:MAG: hypothetical protein ABSH32_33455 [Bryobacteraceae bacterium]|jgi:hypothetical protein
MNERTTLDALRVFETNQQGPASRLPHRPYLSDKKRIVASPRIGAGANGQAHQACSIWHDSRSALRLLLLSGFCYKTATTPEKHPIETNRVPWGTGAGEIHCLAKMGFQLVCCKVDVLSVDRVALAIQL